MRKTLKRIAFILVFIIIVALVATIFCYVKLVRPSIVVFSEEIVKEYVINAINDSNDILMKNKIFYDDYFEIAYDKEDKITSIKANTGLINQINMIMQTEIQNRLNDLVEKRYDVPLGTLLGSAIFADLGKGIKLNVKSKSNCFTVVKSHFEQEGINQTKHTLIVTAYIDVDIITPLQKVDTLLTNDLVLAENIIVGEVPQTYIDEQEKIKYLDLIS